MTSPVAGALFLMCKIKITTHQFYVLHMKLAPKNKIKNGRLITMDDFKFDYVLGMRTLAFIFIAASLYGLSTGII